MNSLPETFDTPENNYIFHYDESNNVRALTLFDDKYNIDNDHNQKPSMNFILAGIVHKPIDTDIDFNTLINNLSLQNNISEIKFKHIAKGNFEQILKSDKLTIFLDWILNSKCFIHYFNLNMEYWSFIDLVDDVFYYARENSPDRFNKAIHVRHYLDYYKDALNRLIKLDKSRFLSLVKRYGYPKVKPGFERKLIKEINKLLKENLRQSRLAVTGANKQTQREFEELSKLLDMCNDISKLETTIDLDEDVLLNGFHYFYHNRCISFKNSVHNFDMESVVEEKFEILKNGGDKNLAHLNYGFVDSKISYHIQLSDIVSGLFNKYFTYIESESIESIRKKRGQLNEKQLKNLNLLGMVVEKSHLECQQFLFYVMSLSESEKHNFLLFENEDV